MSRVLNRRSRGASDYVLIFIGLPRHGDWQKRRRARTLTR